MYLHIFEDGNIKQVESEPTQDDRDSVDAGIDVIIRFKDGNFESMESDGSWTTLKKLV